MPLARTLSGAISAAVISAGCAPDRSGPDPRPTDDVWVSDPSTIDDTGFDPDAVAAAAALYDPTRVVEIAIDLDPADAEALMAESSDLFEVIEGEDCMDQPLGSDFTWFPADLTIDGRRFEQVGVRKKGLIGSMSETRPGLKVKLDKFVAGQTMDGIERLTLNTPEQDPSLVKQCLAYQLYRDAGLEASRCNYAHFTLQGEDLGIYVNIEPVKKLFLREAFGGDDDGDLYEGAGSDFREGWTETFQADTSSTDPARAPIHALADALEITDDPSMLAAVDALVDLDAFRITWALETIAGVVDGYSGNTNNFYVYFPEHTGKAAFLPWGLDATFSSEINLSGADPSQVVMNSTQLTRRLWNLDAQRERYVATLRGLLDTLWDEDALEAEVARMSALIDPYALPDPKLQEARGELRTFIRERQPYLEAELLEPLPTFDEPLRQGYCLLHAGELAATLQTVWGGGNPLETGRSEIIGTLHAEALAVSGGAQARFQGDGATLHLAGTTPDGVLELVVSVPLEALGVGTTVLDGLRNPTLLIQNVDGQRETIATLWQGSVRFEVIDTRPGGPVRAEVVGELYTGGPAM